MLYTNTKTLIRTLNIGDYKIVIEFFSKIMITFIIKIHKNLSIKKKINARGVLTKYNMSNS
jgi:hypothetical protein